MLQKNIPRFLVVNPYGIGDVLFCTPLIRTLKKKYPYAYTGILLGSRTKALFEFNPDLDAILIYDKQYFKTLSFWKKGLYLFNLTLEIRKHDFNHLIDLSNTDEYAGLAKWIWNIPYRIGFQYKHRGRHLTHKIKLEDDFSNKHVVDYYYRLLECLHISPTLFEKKLYFYPDPSEQRWLEVFLQDHRLSKKHHLILFLPGGGASWGSKAHYKYWSPKHYVTLTHLFLKDPFIRIILIGGPEDQIICKTIFQEVDSSVKDRVVNLAGLITIPQLATLMKFSKLIVGTESGPLHLSTAIDCPSIFIFGPVDPNSYGPFSQSKKQIALNHPIPCHPCYQRFKIFDCTNRRCLNDLSPTTVFEKAEKLLSF